MVCRQGQQHLGDNDEKPAVRYPASLFNDLFSLYSTLPGHLGLISMMVGRKIQWGVAGEKIVGDSEASALLSRPSRAPYTLA